MATDFKAKLLNISDNLDEDNLAALKFLLGESVPKVKLCQVKDGKDLFEVMEAARLLGPQKHATLRQGLLKIGRNDLAEKLNRHGSISSLSGFRIHLHDIAVELCKDSLDKALYLCPKIPKGVGIENWYDFLRVMMEKGLITKNDTSQLQQCLDHIGRKDLVSKLQDWKHQESNGPSNSSRVPQHDQGDFTRASDDIDTDASGAISNSTKTDILRGALGKSIPDRELVKDNKILLEAAESVGIIGESGTGFMVGGGCILTAAHVFRDALGIPADKCNGYNYLSAVSNQLQRRTCNLGITFTSMPSGPFFRIIGILFMDTSIDTAVAQIEPTVEYPFPAKLTNFMEITADNVEFELLGHHDAYHHMIRDRKCKTITDIGRFQNMKQQLESVIGYGNLEEFRTRFGRDLLEDYDRFGSDPRYIEFHCSMKQGASGSPGVVLCNDTAYVFTMLRAGYPDGYTLPEHLEDLCVEQGVRLTAICQSIQQADPSLCAQIFPNGIMT